MPKNWIRVDYDRFVNLESVSQIDLNGVDFYGKKRITLWFQNRTSLTVTDGHPWFKDSMNTICKYLGLPVDEESTDEHINCEECRHSYEALGGGMWCDFWDMPCEQALELLKNYCKIGEKESVGEDKEGGAE